MLRSGKSGGAIFAAAWIACYFAVVVFGIGVAVVHSWVRPRAQDEAARLKFEDSVMTAIIAAGLFSLLSVLIR
jgi:hypothetical protein